MKYLAALQGKKLFRLSDVEEITGNVNTAKSLLQNYKKAGYITSIRRNLYASLELSTGAVQANRFEIACAINDSSYLSHHSALEYYGISNQIYYTILVATQERFTSFEYGGVRYLPHNAKMNSGTYTPVADPLIKVTDLERTIIDCIDDLEKAGGLEEFLYALQMIPYVKEDRLLYYLEEYNQIFLWQKAGYILEYFSDQLGISQRFFEICKSHIHNRKKYLIESSNLIYHKEWKLYAPADLRHLRNQGVDEFV